MTKLNFLLFFKNQLKFKLFVINLKFIKYVLLIKLLIYILGRQRTVNKD